MLWWLMLGMSTGMRTMTAMAVLCWCAWLGLLPEPGWAAWSAMLFSAIVFTVFALGEYVGDTLPSTPSRKKIPLMLARLCFGALAGSLGAHAMGQPVAGGVVFGMVGALIGTYGGYRVRMFLASKLGHDLPVALVESAFALMLALVAAHAEHQSIVMEAWAMKNLFR